MTRHNPSLAPLLWAFLASATVSASAQTAPPAGPRVATPHGVSFTLPARFQAVPNLVAAPALQTSVAQAFSDAGDMPVHVFVLKASPPQPDTAPEPKAHCSGMTASTTSLGITGSTLKRASGTRSPSSQTWHPDD